MLYYLNKILHSNDWYYQIELPDIVWAEHPLGSVLGRAKYGNGFFFMQNCTVGGSPNASSAICYPTIGENVLLYAGSSILGEACIGNNVIISAGTLIINEQIPDNCMVFGRSPHLIIKQKEAQEMIQYISRIWKV